MELLEDTATFAKLTQAHKRVNMVNNNILRQQAENCKVQGKKTKKQTKAELKLMKHGDRHVTICNKKNNRAYLQYLLSPLEDAKCLTQVL